MIQYTIQFQIHNNQIQIPHKDRQMIVAKYLNNLIFHKLKKTEEMYKQVLDIDFINDDFC
jgi:hypothetical protein